MACDFDSTLSCEYYTGMKQDEFLQKLVETMRRGAFLNRIDDGALGLRIKPADRIKDRWTGSTETFFYPIEEGAACDDEKKREVWLMMNGADTAGEHYLNSLSAGQLEREHFTSKELPIGCFNDGLNCRRAGGVRVDVGVLTRGGPCQRYGGNTAFSVVAAAYSVDTDSTRARCEKVAWSVLDVCREVAKNDSCRRGLMMPCTFNEKYDRE